MYNTYIYVYIILYAQYYLYRQNSRGIKGFMYRNKESYTNIRDTRNCIKYFGRNM